MAAAMTTLTFCPPESLRKIGRGQRSCLGSLKSCKRNSPLELVVLGDISVESDVLEVLADELAAHLAGSSSLTRSLKVIELLDELGESEVEKPGAVEESVLLVGKTLELDCDAERKRARSARAQGERQETRLTLVGVRLLELLATDDALEKTGGAVLADDGGLEKLDLLGSESASSLGRLLLVDSVLVTPLDVLHGGLLEVLLDMVEGVLGDVGDTEVGVLLDLARVRKGLSSEELDEGRLSGSVGSDDTDTRRERDGAGDVLELGLLGAGVGEGAAGHLEDGAGLGADTHERSGRGEGELDDRVGEGVVGLSSGPLLDELGEVALVVVELLLLVVNDVGADGVEESRVVRNDHAGDVALSVEVCERVKRVSAEANASELVATYSPGATRRT